VSPGDETKTRTCRIPAGSPSTIAGWVPKPASASCGVEVNLDKGIGRAIDATTAAPRVPELAATLRLIVAKGHECDVLHTVRPWRLSSVDASRERWKNLRI
jgi:hypothetical protein